ncbi:MAG: DUF4493 domain-containing protein [Muribaculaceae bacterium]|nr:DUF4493 domain-containing protein [Muribaculaceae bacterium]
MKKYLHYILAFPLLVAISCGNDVDDPSSTKTQGTVSLSLTADLKVVDSQISRTMSDEQMAVLKKLSAEPKKYLSVSLYNSDGSLRESWDTAESFPETLSIPVGQYSLAASYGDPSKEGFDLPSVYGHQDIFVRENVNTNVNLITTLQNSLVGVDYSDSFKNLFSSYKATLTTSTGNILFDGDESRLAYVAPGNVTLSVNFIYKQGDTYQTTVKTFTAQAAHLQKFYFDVDIDKPTVSVIVTFDDSMTQETMTFDIGKNIDGFPLPEVNPEGFTGNETTTLVVNDLSTISKPYRFNVYTEAGLKAATLSVQMGSTGVKNYDLMNEAQKETLSAMGFLVTGFRSGSNMALVEMTDWVKSLSLGNGETSMIATVTLSVTDMEGKTTDPELENNNIFIVKLTQ